MTRKSFKAGLLLTTILVAGTVRPAEAGHLSRVQAEINALSARLAQVKAAQAADEGRTEQAALRQARFQAQMAARNAAANKKFNTLTPTRAEQLGMATRYVSKGALPGSFVVPGTNTSVYVGGFVNFQAAYDLTQNLGPKFSIGNLQPNAPAFRATNRAGANTFHFQGKVSRLIVETSTPSSYGPVTTNISLDFYGFTAGGNGFQALQNNNWSARIVYAYGTVGGLLVGQANSNFLDTVDQEETFDNAGPAGVAAGHAPQIRYTFHLGNALLSTSLENPQTGYEDTQYSSLNPYGSVEIPSKTNVAPDLTVRYQITDKIGHFQVSAVARDLGYTDMNGHRTTKPAAAILGGATLNLDVLSKAFGPDSVGFQAWYGAMGRYIPDDFGANVASVLAVNNGTLANPTGATAIAVQPDVGFTVYAQHWWSKRLRSNIGIGYNHQRLASFLPANYVNAPDTATMHTNLILRLVPSVDLGVEYMIGRKTFQKSTAYKPVTAQRIVFGGIWHF